MSLQTLSGSQLQSKLAQTLGSAQDVEPGSAKVQTTALETFIRKILGDEIKKVRGQRLTWATSSPPDVAHDRDVGLFCPNLPFVGPIGGFWVQNCQLLRSNGTVGSLDELSDELNKWAVERNGVRRDYSAPSDRETVRKALEAQRAEAIRTDPLLCDICASFRAESNNDLAKHKYWQHPEEFGEIVGSRAAEKVEVAVPTPAVAPDGELFCCGKPYKPAGLAAHRRFKHGPASQG